MKRYLETAGADEAENIQSNVTGAEKLSQRFDLKYNKVREMSQCCDVIITNIKPMAQLSTSPHRQCVSIQFCFERLFQLISGGN